MDNVMPKLQEGGKGEIERDIEYILSGLDKLYSGSKTLTDDQIENAGNMALQRLQGKVVKAQDRGQKQKEFVMDSVKKAGQAASDEIEAELGKDFEELKTQASLHYRSEVIADGKMAGLKDVGPRDHDKFNEIRKRTYTLHRMGCALTIRGVILATQNPGAPRGRLIRQRGQSEQRGSRKRYQHLQDLHDRHGRGIPRSRLAAQEDST